MKTETFLKPYHAGKLLSDLLLDGKTVLSILDSFKECIEQEHKVEVANLKNNIYHIEIEIRDSNGKLFNHPISGMFTGFKYLHYYKDYVAMESHMRMQHMELKMLMPNNQFNITASVYNSIGYSYMQMAEFRGEENKFVIFT